MIRLPAPCEEFALLWWPQERLPRLPGLSAAEADVAELAIRSLSNADIGRARGRSSRTIANQLANVYRKLGVGSRVELAAHLAGLRSRPERGPPRGET